MCRRPVFVEDQQYWYPRYLEFVLQRLKSAVSEGNADPGKRFEVFVEAGFVFVTSDVDDFQPLVWEVDVIVELYEDRREDAAGRTPVGSAQCQQTSLLHSCL